jgi:hypothetical protein
VKTGFTMKKGASGKAGDEGSNKLWRMMVAGLRSPLGWHVGDH